MVFGVWTGVGFSDLKTPLRNWIRIQIFWTGAESESENVTPATSTTVVGAVLLHNLIHVMVLYTVKKWTQQP